VPKAAVHPQMAESTIVVGKPILDAPIVLRTDVKQQISMLLPALLRFALQPATSVLKKKKVTTYAFTPAEVCKRFVTELQGPVADALSRAIDRGDLPADFAWVEIKGNPHLFLLENLRYRILRPALPTEAQTATSAGGDRPCSPLAQPGRDFAEAFREAFERL